MIVIFIIIATSSLSIGNVIKKGILGLGAYRLIRLPFPRLTGMTIKLAIPVGSVIVRGSFCMTNPTEVTQDFVVMSDGSDLTLTILLVQNYL